MEISPVIVAIGFNRVNALKRLLDSLERAVYYEKVTLIVSIDHGGDAQVAAYAIAFEWTHGEKIVKLHTKNLGLKKHVLECADYSISYGAAIILEDDIMVSPFFYSYAKQAVNTYKNNKKIFAVSLYSQSWNGYANREFVPLRNEYDAFITQIECSWGECFIGERWIEFREWYKGKENYLLPRNDVPSVVFSWKDSRSKFLLYYIVEKELFYLTPYESFTTNFHKAGTHAHITSPAYQVPLMHGEKKFSFPTFEAAIKYDAFFESNLLKEKIERRFHGKRVCVDYFGLHDDYEEYDICFSTAELSYEVIENYGLELRPPELNYLYNIPGDDLFLYNLKRKCKHKRRKSHHYNMIHYDVKDLQWIDSLFYTLYEWWKKVRG